MKAARFSQALALISVASLSLVACAGAENENPDNGNGSDSSSPVGETDLGSVSGTLTGAGASSFQLAIEEWTFEFEEASEALVDYTAVGSGQGRSQFLSGAADFAGSDAVMDDEEYEQSTERCGDEGAFHIPTAILPIGVLINLEGVEEVNLDADTLASIFAGDITSWDDPAIAEHNPDAELPDTPITVIHRSDDSGTTENFTDYLAEASDVWEYEADGAWPSEVSSESADGTTGVIDAMSSQDGAITYADAGQAPDTAILANIEVGGEYSELTPEAAGQAVATSERIEGQAENNIAFDLTRDTEEAGSYPIVQVAYTIWCNSYDSADEAELAAAFADYIVSEEAQSTAEAEAGASPLTPELREEAAESISNISG